MSPKNDPQGLARMFKALSADNRVRIVHLLSGRSLCVGALSKRLGISAGAVSQHLRVLKDAGLVEAGRRACFIHYRINPDAAARWKSALESLLGVSRADRASRPRKKGGRSCVMARRSVKSRRT